MGLADDLIARNQRLAQDRLPWDAEYQTITRLVMPTEPDMRGAYGGARRATPSAQEGPRSPGRGKSLYDNTGMLVCDRLAAGMDSLVTPMNDKWHGLGVTDPLAPKLSQEDREYLDRARDYQFAVRYNPMSGFVSAHQKMLRSVVAFGTAVGFAEENYGKNNASARDVPVRYRYMPLAECLLAADECGFVDTNFRNTMPTVRQLAQKHGSKKLSAKLQRLLEKPETMDQTVEVLHAICPRQEKGSMSADTVKGSAWASYYIEVDTRHVIDDSGFFEFPYWVYHWLQQDNGAYGESPIMLVLSEIKGLQHMGKNELRAFQQWTDPPLAVANEGVINRPNLNARAVNMGGIDRASGHLMIRPIITATQPQFVEEIMNVRRGMVREGGYLNLFQVLVKNPQMTATEAMIRNNEKGELLGPAGAKIQAGLAKMSEREWGIYTRKGIFEQDSAFFPPPEALQNRDIGMKFTSPLDRLRRMNEVIGIQRTLELLLPLAKAKPKVLDRLDEDRIAEITAEVTGAPIDILHSEEDMEEIAAEAARKKQMMEAATLAQPAADAAKNLAVTAKVGTEAAQNAPAASEALNDILKRAKGAAERRGDRGAAPGLDALLSQFGEAPVQ